MKSDYGNDDFKALDSIRMAYGILVTSETKQKTDIDKTRNKELRNSIIESKYGCNSNFTIVKLKIFRFLRFTLNFYHFLMFSRFNNHNKLNK